MTPDTLSLVERLKANASWTRWPADSLEAASALEAAAAEIARLTRVRAPVICTGCGSTWTDDDLRAEKARDPRLLSCCPERKHLTITGWRDRATAAAAEIARLTRERDEAREVLAYYARNGGCRARSFLAALGEKP